MQDFVFRGQYDYIIFIRKNSNWVMILENFQTIHKTNLFFFRAKNCCTKRDLVFNNYNGFTFVLF